MDLFHLYQQLTTYGNFYPTTHMVNDSDGYVEWTEQNFDYVRYNPRKEIISNKRNLHSLAHKNIIILF